MRLERWVLPPAIATAVFTTMAIVPPGGAPAVGLRVEALGSAYPRRPFPVRLAMEAAGAQRWRAPRSADLVLRGDHVSSHAHAVLDARDAPYLSAVLPAIDEPPRELTVSAGGFHARARLVPGTMPEAPSPAESRAAEGGIAVRVEGGSLVPEVPATLWVHLDIADQDEVGVASADSAVQVTPSRARVDLCRVAQFEVTVRGSDAHIIVDVPGGPEREVHRRLAVTPGGLSLRAHGGDLDVIAPVGDQTVYLAAGDALGPTWWGSVRLPDVPDANASARIVPPADAAWILASFSLSLDGGAGEWLTVPPGAQCPHTPLGERWSQNATPLPSMPSVVLLVDGAALAAQARAVRQRHARWLALALASASLAMLIALVIVASLQRDPEALRDVSATTRQRLWIALLGSATLLVGGFVLLYTFVLRS